jgi:hypothetical protein
MVDLVMTSRAKLLLVAFVVIAVAGTVEVFKGPTLVRQLINMKHAEQHLPTLQKSLDAYPEFSKVRPCVSDMAEGILSIDGCVRTEADFKHLREVVESTKPPVKVGYNVDVVTNEADRLVVWPDKDASANGSQPHRAGTNGTTGSADSRRWPHR